MTERNLETDCQVAGIKTVVSSANWVAIMRADGSRGRGGRRKEEVASSEED